MSDVDPIFDVEARRALWKKEYGDKAEFTSRDGYVFNVFDDEWILEYSAIGKPTVKLDWLHSSQFDHLTQCDIRIALGNLATELAPASTQSNISALKNSNLPNLKKQTLEGYWPILKYTEKNRIKSLIGYLHEYNPDKYKQEFYWAEDKFIRCDAIDPFNLKNGALSDIENQSFNVSLNQRMNEILTKYSLGQNELINSDQLRDISRYIIFRFIQALVRRPVQIRQLKWNDIIPVGSSFNDKNVLGEYAFSDEQELQVRIWRSKRKGNYFRSHAEGRPILLNASISNEVLFYRRAYFRAPLIIAF